MVSFSSFACSSGSSSEQFDYVSPNRDDNLDISQEVDNSLIELVTEVTPLTNQEKDQLVASETLVINDYFKNCVLQRNTCNLVFGTTSKTTSRVIVEINKKAYSGEAYGESWQVYLPPLPAGGPFLMEVFTDTERTSTQVYIGDVFILSGQSNMEWTMRQCRGASTTARAIQEAEDDPQLRLLNLELNGSSVPLKNIKGNVNWTSSNRQTIFNFSCTGYQFGKYLREKLQIPIGLVANAVGGATIGFWMSSESITKLRNSGVQFYESNANRHWKRTNVLISKASDGYNALIEPLLKHRYRGVLWYQGASDTGYASFYQAMLEEMIAQYREAFKNPHLLFVLYELCRFGGDFSARGIINGAFNDVALKDPYSCVVPNHDLGDYNDIHPQDKQELSFRAAEETAYYFYKKDREKNYLELDKIKRTDEGIMLYFRNEKDGIVLKNELCGLEISNDGEWFEDVKNYELGTNTIFIKTTMNVKHIRYGFGTTLITQQMIDDVSLHASIYNSDLRPLRMFDIELN